MKRRFDGQPRAADRTSKTAILDVNDDCLHEVFRHLDLFDLFIVADVCNRFRANAQGHFRKHKYLDINSIYRENRMLGVFKMLRHTGAYAESVEVLSPISNCNKTNEIAVLESISRYCTNDEARLILKHFDATDDFVASLPQRVVMQIKRKYAGTTRVLNKIYEIFHKMNHSSNHVEMDDSGVLSFRVAQNIELPSFEKIIKKNPKLRKIEMIYCPRLDYRVLPLIVARAPQIESLRFISYSDDNIAQPGFNQDFMCLSQLSKLNALTISCRYYSFSSAIDAMAAANIPLERLNIEKSNVDDQADVFVAAISKFKNLKSLKLSEISSLNLSHLTTIAESLVELTELHLSKSIALNRGNIVVLMQSIKKLEHFHYQNVSEGKMYIDDNVHAEMAEMVKIAKERHKKIHLKISRISDFFIDWGAEIRYEYEIELTLSVN